MTLISIGHRQSRRRDVQLVSPQLASAGTTDFLEGWWHRRQPLHSQPSEETMPKAPKSVDHDPRETPADDPRQQTDMPTHRQTDQPWQGNPEKDQIDPKRPPIDLEKWQKSNTH
ncbi:hypothetical protein [Bradyrhizobium sp. RDT46]|uniref:hypothetical protein n=2 Tax=Bradyrhizobium TaxID=374 RepID=UPI0035C7749C